MRSGLWLVASLVLLAACETSSKDDEKAEKAEKADAGAKEEQRGEAQDADEAPPEEAAPVEDDDVPAQLEQASFSAKDVDGGGLKAKSLACDGDGELMTLLTNVAGLAVVKDELSACSDEKLEPRVMYEVKGGTVSGVKVADAGAAKDCIAKAVAGATIPNLEGTCLVTLALGD